MWKDGLDGWMDEWIVKDGVHVYNRIECVRKKEGHYI